MATWLSAQTTDTPLELNDAINKSCRRTNINRYRSRTDVTDDLIRTAFSWMRLPILVNEELVAPPHEYLKYTTKAIQRGIGTEIAKANAEAVLMHYIEATINSIITFNTGTAAAASEAVKEMLDADTAYTELDVRTMLTSTPNHKIHVYKRLIAEEHVMYVVLNNVDTPGVIFKLAAAIMLDQHYFANAETTQKFAEAWMSGNPETIFNVVTQYYKDYNNHRQEREFNNAISTMVTNLTEQKKKTFENNISQYQREIDQYYNHIRELTTKLNSIKAQYLLQVTVNEDQKIVDLKEYFKSCKDKISYISAGNNSIVVIYKTPLIYFEEDLLKPYFESTRDNVIKDAPDWVRQMLKDIFFEKKYTLLIESGVTMNLADRRFQYIRPESYIESVNLKGIPNPHHKYYNCWGDNQSIIFRALQDSDYLTAFLTAFAAMAGLSLSDTAVMDKFVRDEIYMYYNINCLKNEETKEIISFSEYERRYRNASDASNE